MGVVVLCALIGAGGVTLWYVHSHQTSYYLRRARALEAEQDYTGACEQYRRAHRRSGSAREQAAILFRLAQSLGESRRVTFDQSLEKSLEALKLLAEADRLAPDNQEAARLLLAHLWDLARLLDTPEAWHNLYRQADQMVGGSRAAGPAVLCRALAAVALAGSEPGRREQLPASLDVLSDKQLVAGHESEAERALGLGKLYYAEAMRAGGRDKVAASYQANAETAVRLLLAKADRSLSEAEAGACVLAESGYLQNQPALIAEAIERLADAVSSEEAVRKPAAVIDATRLALALVARSANDPVPPPGLARLLAALVKNVDAIVQQNPQNLQGWLVLGQLREVTGDRQKAVAAFRIASRFSDAVQGISTPYLLWSVKVMASEQRLRLLLDEMHGLDDPDRRVVIQGACRTELKQLQLLLSQVKGHGKDTTLFTARVQLESGRPKAALLQLWPLIQKTGQRRPIELLVCAGLSMAEMGQSGSAAETLLQAMEREDADPQTAAIAAPVLVDSLLAAGEARQARAVVNQLRQRFPQSRILKVQAARLLRTGEPGMSGEQRQASAAALAEAESMLGPLAQAGVDDAAEELAEVLTAKRDIPGARTVLEEGWASNPYDGSVFRKLIELDLLVGDTEKVRSRVGELLTRSLPGPLVTRLRQAAANSLTNPRSLLELARLAFIPDPVNQRLGLIQYCFREEGAAQAMLILDVLAAEYPDDERVLEMQFEMAMKRDRIDLARQAIPAAAEAKLDQAILNMWEGEISLRQGQFYRAAELLEASVKRFPLLAESWTLLGEACEKAGLAERAVHSYEQAIKLKPQAANALLALHAIYDRGGQPDKALEYLRRAITLSDLAEKEVSAYLNYEAAYGRREEVLAYREALARTNPENEENRRLLAMLYHTDGRGAEARAMLERLCRSGREKLDNNRAMARFLMDVAGRDAGLQYLREYVVAQGAEAGAEDWLALARLLRSVEHTEEAYTAYREAAALESAPELTASRELGDWMMAAGMWERALEPLLKVWQATGDAQAGRKVVEILLQRQYLARAEDILGKLLDAGGESLDLLLLAGRLAYAQDNRDQAMRTFSKAVRMYANDPRPYVCRAATLFDEETEETKQLVKSDLEESLSLNPHLSEVREMLAAWLRREGRLDDAAAQVRRLVEARPQVLRYRGMLAGILAEAGKQDELEKYLQRTRAEMKDDPSWLVMIGQLREEERRPENALVEYLRAIAIRPDEAAVAKAASLLLEFHRPAAAGLALELRRPILISARLLALQAEMFLQLGDRQAAFETFREALARVLPDADERQFLTEQVHRLLYPEEVRALVVSFRGLRVDVATWLVLADVLNRFGAYAETTDILIAIKRGMEPRSVHYREVLLKLGKNADLAQRHNVAIASYEEFLQLNPDNTAVLSQLAYDLAVFREETDRAFLLVQNAERLQREAGTVEPALLNTLGLVYLKRGELQAASHALERCLAFAQIPSAYTHLAMMEIARFDLAAARRHFAAGRQAAIASGNALDLRQNLVAHAEAGLVVQPQEWLDVVQMHLASGQTVAAKEMLDRLLVDTGYELSTLLLEAQYQIAVGDRAGATQLLERIVNQDSSQRSSREWLDVAAACGQIDLALAELACRKALEQAADAEVQSQRSVYAEWLASHGRPADAAALYEHVPRTDMLPAARAQIIDWLMEAGKMEEAKAEAEAFVQDHPTSPVADLTLARTAVLTDDDAQANQALRVVLAFAGNEAATLVLEAKQLFNQDRFDASATAEMNLRRALQEKPGHLEASKLLVELYRREMRYEDAKPVLNTAVYWHPLDQELFRQFGELCLEAGWINDLEGHLKVFGLIYEGSAEKARFQAELALAKGETEKAVQLFTLLYRDYPTPDTLYKLADLMAGSEKLDEAVALLRTEMPKTGGSAKLNALFASLLIRSGATSEGILTLADTIARTDWDAVAESERLIEHCRGILTPDLLVRLVSRLRQERASEISIDRFLTVLLQAEPVTPATFDLLSRLRNVLSGSYAEAGVILLTAEAYASNGRNDEARMLFEQALRQRPSDPLAYRRYAAFLLHRAGNPVEATAAARQAVNLAEGMPPIIRANCLDTLGETQLAMGLMRLAWLTFSESVRTAETVENRIHLGRVLLDQGQHRAAELEFKRVQYLARQAGDEEMLAHVHELLALAAQEP